MQIPAEISFEHLEHSNAIEGRVRAELAKLEQFYDRITSARVVVSRPQRRHRHGDAYEVRIQLSIPGAADIIISRQPGNVDAHGDVYVAIRDAFSAAQRQLQDVGRVRQSQVKAHDEPPHGVIVRLDVGNDHGFISTSDGREIYFHRNSVTDNRFEELEVGDVVRFAEDRGDKGPHATYVRRQSRQN
jgi:cold shock CspA family protein/ribosome-associated translation inhibitor RaiA